jgi:segregation and condensation protein B
MYTKPQQHDVVRRFIKSLRPPLRLTMPALETLAVIAYKQPVTSPEISEIRGVNTSGVISTLLDKRLITTAGRKEVIGRPILYKTSKEFLMRFGLSDLEELPSLKEFEALAREALGSDEGVVPSAGQVASDEWRVASEGAAANGEGSGVASEGAAANGEGSGVATGAAASEDHTHSTPSKAIEQVQKELAEAEAFREQEALATAEGMPSGQLDEDPPPPVVKATAAGE